MDEERQKLYFCDQLNKLINRITNEDLPETDKVILVVALDNLAGEIISNYEGIKRLYGEKFFQDLLEL